MRSWFGIALVVTLILGTGGIAAANTITFEDQTLGASIPIVPGLVYPDVTFTYVGNSGNPVFTVEGSPGPPLSGNVILGPDTHVSGEAYKAVFTSSTSFFDVSVDMGDFDADDDFLFLNAFDSSNNLIASATGINPASVNGGLTLGVHTATPIAYVLFNEDLSFPGSIFFDNFTYGTTAVPEPSSLLLLGSGILGLAGLGWRWNR